MFGRRVLGGLAMAGAAVLHLTPGVLAQDRMQLGAPIGAAQFQSDVGDRVFFSESSAALGTRARAAIEAQATWLVRYSSIPLTIEGHADEPGTATYNLDVSQRRAQAVRAQLIAYGVEAARIAVVAYGRERPVADCAGATCAAQNRRTVTVLGPVATVPVDARSLRGLDRPSPRRLF